ncbi:hypothetical protein HY485_04985 [Candidatus Woesearchaeota archaeon]|nr:hypothetical protein [Candidatus Woesearchaeota archaeon]
MEEEQPVKKTKKITKIQTKHSLAEPRKVATKTKQEKIMPALEQQTLPEQQTLFSGSIVLVLAVLVALLFYNQLQLFELSALAGVKGVPYVALPAVSGGTLSLSDGEKVTYAPVLLAAGEAPVLQGYGTKIKELPTVSAQPKKQKTGDVVQDTLNKIVPTGTPEYGQEIGVSFDDPINAQRRLGQLEQTLTLNQQQEQRWLKIVSAFTCDYCCGSPQRPTRITNCGCAHAAAWRGLAKFLISKYGDKISDEQVAGELSKWKALWYPGPTVQRIIQEQSATGGKIDNAPVSIDALPQMVGGC